MRTFSTERLAPVAPHDGAIGELTGWFEYLDPPRQPAQKVRTIDIDPANHPVLKAERQLGLLQFESADWKKAELAELVIAWADLRGSVQDAARLARFDAAVHRLAGNGPLIGAEVEAALLAPLARALECGWSPALVPLFNLGMAATCATGRERRKPGDRTVRDAVAMLTKAFAQAQTQVASGLQAAE